MKGGLIALLGKPKGKAEPETEKAPDGEEGDADAGLDAAAEEILAAVSAGDAGALKTALKSFYEQC